MGTVGVDRDLSHPFVAASSPVGADPGPGDHLPTLLGHHHRIPAAPVTQESGEIAGCTRLSLEGRSPLIDALVMDPGNRLRDCLDRITDSHRRTITFRQAHS